MFSKQLCKVIAPQLFNLKWKGKVEGLFVWGWDQNEYMHLPRLTLLQPGFVTRYAVTMIKLSLPSWNRVKPLLPKGPFNNYVDKMRRGGGQKMSGFCPRSGYKNCPCRGVESVKKWQNSVHEIVEWPLKLFPRNQKAYFMVPTTRGIAIRFKLP